jgi:hypothetical protein
MVGSNFFSSTMIGLPSASMNWILPTMRRIVWSVELFCSLSFAGVTTLPEPCSTRSVIFISMTSPVTSHSVLLIAPRTGRPASGVPRLPLFYEVPPRAPGTRSEGR